MAGGPRSESGGDHRDEAAQVKVARGLRAEPLAPGCANRYNDLIRTIPLEPTGRFDQLIEDAQREPVTATLDGRPAAVVMSVESYERMSGRAWDRVIATMDRVGSEVERRGLTDEILEQLLADES